jgi:hypothetical protein
MSNGTLKSGSLLPILLLLSGTLAAEDLPSFSVGGLLFGDLYHISSHHLPEGDGATGAVIRRGYLTGNAKFSKTFFGRARLELNQSGKFETYDFEVGFKDLYVGWDRGRHRLIAGLSPTPTFDLIESVWGFRYLARTPLDLQGVASRDTGISVKGPLNASGSLNYRAMLAAGLEFGNESGDGRKLMGALNWKPAKGWDVDFYLDYEKLSGPRDRTTAQVFVGYRTERQRWGAQYSHQDREADPVLELASAFYTRMLGEKFQFVGRVDRIFEPSPKGNNISYLPFDPTAPATFYVTGLEYRAGPHAWFTPNIVYIHYDRNDEGVRPESDLHWRLTLFFPFE